MTNRKYEVIHSDEVKELIKHHRNYFITNGIAELFIDIELEQLKEQK